MNTRGKAIDGDRLHVGVPHEPTANGFQFIGHWPFVFQRSISRLVELRRWPMAGCARAIGRKQKGSTGRLREVTPHRVLLYMSSTPSRFISSSNALLLRVISASFAL